MYYTKRREYKTLVKATRAEFISQLSKDIESGVNINWHRFKKIKTQLGKESSLDAFDMLNFCRFFKNLYSKPPLSQERLAELLINKDEPSSSMLENRINRDITVDELGGAINQLKRGKAVSEDLIRIREVHFYKRYPNNYNLSCLSVAPMAKNKNPKFQVPTPSG